MHWFEFAGLGLGVVLLCLGQLACGLRRQAHQLLSYLRSTWRRYCQLRRAYRLVVKRHWWQAEKLDRMLQSMSPSPEQICSQLSSQYKSEAD